LTTQPSRSHQKNTHKPRLPLEERLADEARLFLSWLDNPSIAGAISPSGRFLARTMARYVDPHAEGPVIELGPGTGVITEALLARGVARERLCLIEFDKGFCELLRKRFPGVRIVEGDAYRLLECLRPILDRPAASIVSSLPLLMKPETTRLTLLAEAFDLLDSEGRFIQFTYGPLSPIPLDKRVGLDFCAEGSPPVWLNLPPARVWVYRRRSTDDLPRPERPLQDFLSRLWVEKFPLDLKREIEEARAKLKLGFVPRPRPGKGFHLDPVLRALRNQPDLTADCSRRDD
jgi:phosphatidylethanolamine/phosphatidyl-N-methylethanolamine N-methyltransferase